MRFDFSRVRRVCPLGHLSIKTLLFHREDGRCGWSNRCYLQAVEIESIPELEAAYKIGGAEAAGAVLAELQARKEPRKE